MIRRLIRSLGVAGSIITMIVFAVSCRTADAQTASSAAVAASPPAATQALAAAPLDLTNIVVGAASDQIRHETVRDALVTIDASLEDEFPLGGDQLVKPGNVSNQVVYGGTGRLRLWPGIALFFRRVNHENVAGSTNGTGYGSFGYDIEGDYGIEYAANQNLHFEGFWKYRYRTCCPNAADATAFSATSKTPAGPRAERGIMLNAAYRFGPKTRIGRSFLITEEAQFYDHHLDYTIANNPAYIKAGSTLNGLPLGSDSTLLWETHIYYYLSVFGQTRVVPYIGYEDKPSYFDNTTQPTFQNRVRYGAIMHLTPVFSLDTFVKSDHTYPASATGAHNTTFFTDLLIHVKS